MLLSVRQKVVCPSPTGSGAIVVHRRLEELIPGYEIVAFNPRLTYFPPALRWRVPQPDADIVHTAPDHAMFFQRKGVPLISTFHNFVVDPFMRQYSSLIQRIHYATDLPFFLRRAIQISDRLTAVSQFTADLVSSELNCQKPIEVIPNGVDTEFFTPAEDSQDTRLANDAPLRLLFSGNPSIRKGSLWLPEIARKLGDSVQIVCASGLRGGFTAEMAAAGIENLGQVPYESMPALYRSVDALLLPTVREGDSLAVLEAMSSGLPIVASRVSSLPERVAEGQGGYLCELGDVDGFVAAIQKLQDPQHRWQLGGFNRSRAEQEFSLEQMAARYATLFAEFS